jgi:hypothetical protein
MIEGVTYAWQNLPINSGSNLFYKPARVRAFLCVAPLHHCSNSVVARDLHICRIHSLRGVCTDPALPLELVTYINLETMLADQYTAPLLVDALKAMEALVAEQRNHIRQLEHQLYIFRVGYMEAVARYREIDPSWIAGLNDGKRDFSTVWT